MKTKLHKYIEKFKNQDGGNSATEYAVMLSLIVVVSLAAITLLGVKMSHIFEAVSNIG